MPMYDIEYQKEDAYSTFDITVHDRRTGAVKPLNDGVATKQIKFEKPGNVDLLVDAEFSTDGSDGRLKYVWQPGDLDVVGIWKAQAIVTYGNGSSGVFHSTIVEFMVYDNI